MAIQLEEERLVKIGDVLKELPAPHYRYNPLHPNDSRLLYNNLYFCTEAEGISFYFSPVTITTDKLNFITSPEISFRAFTKCSLFGKTFFTRFSKFFYMEILVHCHKEAM